MIGTHAVDVVVTVYRALDYLRPCLESLRRHHDGFELRVIVVDDGSGPPTADWLRELGATWPALLVIEHDRNLGYTHAVNTGLRASNAEWVVILNSDTVVSEGWLAGMVRCAETAPSVGLVGPLSNAASWQSVPRVFDADGRFAANALGVDLDPDGMAELVRSTSKRRYPRVPVLNGFCMLLRRDVLERVGLMDHVAFGTGYGEENDYCIRAGDAGFELAVADDVFVFHAKSKSFGHALRVELSNRGAKALEAKHGRARVQSLVREIEASPVLRAARQTVEAALVARHDRARLADPLGLRILFLLPVLGATGGANSVVMEAAELAKLGVHVRVGVPRRALGDLGVIYAEVPNVQQLLIAAELDRLLELSKDFDVVIATAAHSMEWVARIVAAHRHILPAYYVQDYEPWFFAEGSADARAAAASYRRVPGALLLVKTQFLARTLRELQAVDATVVEPSLDHATYYPLEGAAPDRVRLTAMVRPQTPRRAAARTMRVLGELARRHGERLQIHVFGCESNDERFRLLERDFAFTNHGVLRRPEVAELLRNSDVFVDLSDYQAFGRAALEAMASGCVPVVPLAGGGAEFAVNDHNALVVDTKDEQACIQAIAGLVTATTERRRQMRRTALATAARYSVRGAALSELQALATATVAWRAAHPHHLVQRRLALSVPTPAPRSRLAVGATLGAWKLPSLHRTWSVIERKRLPKPGTADLAVVVVRPHDTNWNELAAWLRAWRRASGRVVVHVELGSVGQRLVEAQSGLDARTASALGWLSAAADAVSVSSAAIQGELARAGLDAAVIAPALDPIVWHLGPAARRPARQRDSDAAVRVGVIAELAHPGLIGVVERLKSLHGDRVEIETLSARAQVARRGRRVSVPKFRAEVELVDWAFARLDWDLALIPEGEPEAWLECAALGVAAVRVGRDALEATRLASALIEDAAQRVRLASDALAALDDATELGGAAAELLDAVMAVPAKAEFPELPNALRGFAGRFLPRWRTGKFSTDAPPEAFPEARSKTRRKLDKLRRDPAGFLRDSNFKRSLDELLRRLRRFH